MPSLWLSLEAGGYAALATAVLTLLILADVIVEVVALAKAYLAAGAVAGLLAGALLAVAVVVTAVPEAVSEIARELGVSVEEARVLYSAVLFGAAVGVGFGMFISWLLAALLWRLLEPRVDLPRPLLLVTPGFLAAVFLALDLFQAEPKDVALVTAAAPAGVPEAERTMDTPALTRTCRGQGERLPNAEGLREEGRGGGQRVCSEGNRRRGRA
jgi:hypothetical protein